MTSEFDHPTIFKKPTLHFLKSATTIASLPDDHYAEVAFIGRSNSGKSTLINALLNRKGLAKVSQKPGKTRLINLFGHAELPVRLVDLPGYGYAHASRREMLAMGEMIGTYLWKRATLHTLHCCIDARRGAMLIDRAQWAWLAQRPNPLNLNFVVTKWDKLNRREQQRANHALANGLPPFDFPVGSSWETISAVEGWGLEGLRQRFWGQVEQLASEKSVINPQSAAKA